jgi:hypothetical protein
MISPVRVIAGLFYPVKEERILPVCMMAIHGEIISRFND